MKRLSLSLCITASSLGLAYGDHHEGDDLSKKLDALLEGISQPNEVERYEPRMEMRDLTSAASAPGSKTREAYVKLLLERLGKEDTSQAAKAWILRQLENVGSAESVPMLKQTMGVPFHHLRELARRALEQNPSEEAGAALRELAGTEKDRGTKRALIHSLGQRGDAKAVEMIASLLDSKDQELSGTAVVALGKIASDDAVKTLLKQLDGGKGAGVVDALLESAHRLTKHHADKAQPILERLYRGSPSGVVQAAALRGLLAASPERADDLVLLALQSEEAAVRQAAINACRDLKTPSVLPNVLAVKLPSLAADEQAIALAVLGDSNDSTVAAQLSDTLADPKVSAEQQLAIVEVLGKLGGVDAASRLLALVTQSQDDSVKEGSRAALASMPGESVDASLMAATHTGDIDARVQAIQALAARGSQSATPLLYEHADKGPKMITQAALGALGNLIRAEDLPRLMTYLPNGDPVAMKAVVQACRRMQTSEVAVDAVITGMKPLDRTLQEELVPVLGVLGGNKALKTVEEMLDDLVLGKAAMKTLTRWSGAEAGPLMLSLAQKEGADDTDRTLLLRGLARLLDKGEGIEPADRLSWTTAAMKAAKRSDDKQLFLPILSRLGTEESTQALAELFADKELGEAAALAALDAADRFSRRRSGTLKQRLLKDIIRAAPSKDVVERAQKMLDKL